ncbi:heme ABC transporter permease [Thioalkalivibrio sp. ALJT]|uniref:heme ABC transporter permease n=1 Tax=Thioalkalivibrio sp. ALJT TaxID=1158146 RepID=UPI0003761529|nr:heme ABC transporter permease [Thioalkalivibrio sp. ALJT]
MSRTRIQWFHFTAPANFYDLAGRLIPAFALLSVILFAMGLYLGLWVAPPDYQQGDSYRIIYIHVPVAWMSMFLYVLMAIYAGIGLIWRIKMAEVMAKSIAPTGALFTFLALWTGALWGRPTWGVYWVWDARLTSELILLFLFLGYMALHAAIEDRQRAANASAVLALVGVVNVPIIYFSVQWWNTLHQGASITVTQAPTMATIMWVTILIMFLACWMYSIAVVLARARTEILERERRARWVQERLESEKP